jgi:hypothetical protein
MREQHPQVLVAALGDPAQPAHGAGRMLLGCESEPAGEMSCIAKVGNFPTCGSNHQSSRRSGWDAALRAAPPISFVGPDDYG